MEGADSTSCLSDADRDRDADLHMCSNTYTHTQVQGEDRGIIIHVTHSACQANGSRPFFFFILTSSVLCIPKCKSRQNNEKSKILEDGKRKIMEKNSSSSDFPVSHLWLRRHYATGLPSKRVH